MAYIRMKDGTVKMVNGPFTATEAPVKTADNLEDLCDDIKYMRDTDLCYECPFQEQCKRFKDIQKRFNDFWQEEVDEWGD